jgi:hypothetical protein
MITLLEFYQRRGRVDVYETIIPFVVQFAPALLENDYSRAQTPAEQRETDNWEQTLMAAKKKFKDSNSPKDQANFNAVNRDYLQYLGKKDLAVKPPPKKFEPNRARVGENKVSAETADFILAGGSVAVLSTLLEYDDSKMEPKDSARVKAIEQEIKREKDKAKPNREHIYALAHELNTIQSKYKANKKVGVLKSHTPNHTRVGESEFEGDHDDNSTLSMDTVRALGGQPFDQAIAEPIFNVDSEFNCLVDSDNCIPGYDLLMFKDVATYLKTGLGRAGADTDVSNLQQDELERVLGDARMLDDGRVLEAFPL